MEIHHAFPIFLTVESGSDIAERMTQVYFKNSYFTFGSEIILVGL
jgi:hypothetical protein